MKHRLRIVFLTLLVLACARLAQADIYIKESEHSDAIVIMGQTHPAKELIKTTWMTRDKVRRDDPETSIILRMDKGLLYILRHPQKSYMEIPLNFATATEQPAVDLGIQATVTPAGEKKKIGKWNCSKSILKLDMGGMGFAITSEIWATEDIKIDPALYAKFTSALMAANPMLASSLHTMIEEMQKIKGVHVLNQTSIQMMGQTIKTSTTLIEFKEGKAPDGIFELPADYKKQSMMGDMN
ncbi:MAG TPA: DUF4412 domain-containing protein [bacterium]|nr:DUF4412 domain-containing protein [bacterium]HQG46238.1 DUF4412 domain-containing protein [bacterium]HQI47307.1 DUF4412 domain-containing protein [bacterium]HQJ63794.1 DUF4412 domain-containing protein [bacterium]